MSETELTDDMKATLALVSNLLSGKPMWQIMRDAELKRGFTPVPVGSVRWLPLADWGAHDLVSLNGDEVRIVAIGARRPGTGAFTRLIIAIMAENLMPVVICPLAATVEILERWGWQETHAGSTFEDREDQWRPRCLREALGRAPAPAGTITPPDAATPSGGHPGGAAENSGGNDG